MGKLLKKLLLEKQGLREARGAGWRRPSVAPGQAHAPCSGRTRRDVPELCPKTPDNPNPAM